MVTQFDKDDVEAAGLVKFDFLGLRTLTIIDRAVKNIDAIRAAVGEPPLIIEQLPMDDAATYTLLKSGRTTAVFQLESRGMQDLIRRLRPDRFEDVVALVALFRPGPLESGMVGDFISRKHSPAGVHIDYLHPSLAGVLAPTYGVILYQEQVMKIAQVLSGYTLGGADLLRRAMGKKKPEEMAQQRSVFVDGAVARGVPEKQAANIFDLIEKFAGYGFNKSHSAAYALLSYQTGWLKAHYPAAFMAAVMSADMDHTDKVVTLIDECRQMGLTILPPDVNSSSYAFTVADERTIRYGLGAIKGVGQGAVEALIAERSANGEFRDVENLCRAARSHQAQPPRARGADSLGQSRQVRCQSRHADVSAHRRHAGGRAGGARAERGAGGSLRHQRRTHVHRQQRAGRCARAAATGMAGGGAAGGRARDARPLSHRPSHRALREGSAAPRRRAAQRRRERKAAGARRRQGALVRWPLGGCRRAHLGDPRRANRTSFMLDDRTARIEVTLYDEVMQQHRISSCGTRWCWSKATCASTSSATRGASRRAASWPWTRCARRRRGGSWCAGRRSPACTRPRSSNGWRRRSRRSAPAPPATCSCSTRTRMPAACWRSGPIGRVRPSTELLDRLEAMVGREGLHVLYSAPASVTSSAAG